MKERGFKSYSNFKVFIVTILLLSSIMFNILIPVTVNANILEENPIKIGDEQTESAESLAEFEENSIRQSYNYIIETEPNDNFETANQINTEILVYGSFDFDDSADIFKFNLKNDADLDIQLYNYDRIGISWLLYKEANTRDYVAYPTSTDDGYISGSYNATNGNYYLYVYRYGDATTGNYSFTISTGTSETPVDPTDPEQPTNPDPEEPIPGKKYTMAELSQLSYADAAYIISKISIEDITDLFQYNSGAQAFYGDKERVRYLIGEVYNKSAQYTTNDSQGIPTLIEVIRAGFYLGYYYDELSYLNNRQIHDECLYAIKAVQNNPNFRLGTEIQDNIITSIGLLIWNGSCDTEIVNKANPILKQYLENYSSYIGQYSKGNAVYNLMRGIEYDISTYTYYEARLNPEQTQWYGRIDDFINDIGRIALIDNPNSDNGWLINNGLYCISSLGKFHSDNRKGLQVLTDAMNLYPYLSEQYIYAADLIDRNYNGVDYYGNAIDIEQIKEEAKRKYLPNIYNFDNGELIIRTGDKVALEKVKRLYWASKEVAAQYFRSINSAHALETGNSDDVLTVVIYNSPDEYQLNNVLYGLDTNNGGIYIEGMGTLFTYERTPQESIYTLEELFRHEYTHYLQGRYVVPGLWGESEIYKNDRLTWYEEGGAEFFAGSTRKNGILPRKSIIGNVVWTEPSERYDLYKTLKSSYNSGFEFYNYACIAMDFLYNEHFYIYDTLTEYIKNNDIGGYDAYINVLRNDQNLNQQYQNYMQNLIDNYNNFTTPEVSNDYLINHSRRNQSQILADITGVANLTNSNIEIKQSQLFDTFIVRGTYTGSTSQGKIKDIENMNNTMNGFLDSLDNYNWSGYKTVTGYFVNHRVINNKVVFDVVFYGIYP